MRRKFEDFTRAEFLEIVESIRQANSDSEEGDTRQVLDFVELIEHPKGSDLIFWPEDPANHSPDTIVDAVCAWRAAHGKPGLKQS